MFLIRWIAKTPDFTDLHCSLLKRLMTLPKVSVSCLTEPKHASHAHIRKGGLKGAFFFPINWAKIAKMAHLGKFWKLTTLRRCKLACLRLFGSIWLKNFFITSWHLKREFLAIFGVKNGLNQPLGLLCWNRQKVGKVGFWPFFKVF